MTNFALQRLDADAHLVPTGGTSEAGEILRRLSSHPVAIEYAGQFSERLLSKLLSHPQEPNAVDFQTERGDFVFEGLRPTLQSAIKEQRLSIHHFHGAILLDDRYAIADLYVPVASPYGLAARRGLFNTNPLFDGERFVATPYRALDGCISPTEVRGDAPAPAFELTDGEALAAEAGLVLSSLDATHSNALATRNEGRFDAFSANVRDMIEIVKYTRGLLIRLDRFAASEPSIASSTSPALPSHSLHSGDL
ncbi:MAG: hypothetical protein G01um101425_641 [Candidatus Peregrinibacteria bacterium Gr01-1014_25]|nr:MAG: hypothetical protein G01um101425_641 [Candidatus Peregrinibacteria bacterium Gr01-1014_25]